MQLKCRCCLSQVEIPDTSNVGEMQKASGFDFMLLSGGDHTWLCRKTCVPALLKGYNQLVSVLGENTPDASLYQISILAREHGQPTDRGPGSST